MKFNTLVAATAIAIAGAGCGTTKHAEKPPAIVPADLAIDSVAKIRGMTADIIKQGCPQAGVEPSYKTWSLGDSLVAEDDTLCQHAGVPNGFVLTHVRPLNPTPGEYGLPHDQMEAQTFRACDGEEVINRSVLAIAKPGSQPEAYNALRGDYDSVLGINCKKSD